MRIDHPSKTRRQKSLHLQGTKRSKPALPKGKVPEKVKRVSSPPKGVLLLPFSTKKNILLLNFYYIVPRIFSLSDYLAAQNSVRQIIHCAGWRCFILKTFSAQTVRRTLIRCSNFCLWTSRELDNTRLVIWRS
jgi:hypothetical protein